MMINSLMRIKMIYKAIKINNKILNKKKFKLLSKNDMYLREVYDLIFIIYII
jgi:hypothetical protein